MREERSPLRAHPRRARSNRPRSTRTAAAFAVLAAAFASVAFAGNGQWTTNGPYGGLVTVLAVDPQTPANVYAAGFSGVFKSSDSGSHWTRSSSGITDPSVDSLVIDPVTPTTLYAGSIQGGQIAKSTDGAATWSALSNSPTLVTAMAINPQATGTIYAAQQASGLHKTTDGGSTWTSIGVATLPSVPTFSALIVDPATPTTIYAGEHTKGIYKSTDGGASWAAANTGMTGPVFQTISMAIDPKTPSTLYAVVWTSGNPGLFKSTDSGGTWTNIRANGTNFIETVAVDPKTPSTIYVGQFVGTGASALISTDGGATFAPIQTGLPSHTTVAVLAINPVTPTTLYAGTNNGVYKTSNSGGAWTETIDGLALTNVTAVAVDPATPSTIYAGTSLSGLFKSTDSGGSWASINTGIGDTGNTACIVPNITALAIDPTTTTTLYASTSCTESGGVLKSIDGGAHWTVAATGLPEFGTISALAIDPVTTSTIYTAAGNSGLFQSTNAGGIWSADNDGLPDGFFIAGVQVSGFGGTTTSARRGRAAKAGTSSSGTRIGPADGTSTPIVVTFGADAIYLKIGDSPSAKLDLDNDCPQYSTVLFGVFRLQISDEIADEALAACITLLVDRKTGGMTDGMTITVVGLPPAQTSAESMAKASRTRSNQALPNRIRASAKPAGGGGSSPAITFWGPPNGSGADAAACSPVAALVADPLDPTGQSFYGGAACGVLHAINLGRQIVTMNNGLPPNMQINALGITPAGSALYAGATNGGVYQFTLAAQPPTQLVFASINAGLIPTAGVAFDVVVQSSAADLSAQNVASNTTVQLSLASGIGALGGTLSCQIPTGFSSCTVTGVTYSVADTGIVLTATRTAGDTLTAGNSPPFDVVAAQAPTQLAITSVNGGASPFVGAAFNVVVVAQAADLSAQNVATGTTIQLSVTAGAGSLGGTTTCVIPAGTTGCTVVGATYSQPDTGVVLTATRTAGDALTPGQSAAFSVIVAGSAPAATTNAATALTQTTAILHGTVSANGASTTVTFGYGLGTGYGTTIAATQSPLAGSASGAAVSRSISGLACNTLYHFHVVANNGSGGDIDGGDLTLTTSACATAPTTNITAHPPDPSNLTDAVFAFASSPPGATFQCQLDGGAIFACSSPTIVHVGNGEHTFKVQAIGAGGSVDPVGSSFTWLAQGVADGTSIPTLDEYALIVLASLMGLAGVFALRYRKS